MHAFYYFYYYYCCGNVSDVLWPFLLFVAAPVAVALRGQTLFVKFFWLQIIQSFGNKVVLIQIFKAQHQFNFSLCCDWNTSDQKSGSCTNQSLDWGSYFCVISDCGCGVSGWSVWPLQIIISCRDKGQKSAALITDCLSHREARICDII